MTNESRSYYRLQMEGKLYPWDNIAEQSIF